MSKEVDIADYQDNEWLEDRSKSELEVDDELQQSYEQELTNLLVLKWLNEMTTEPKETNLRMQDVDCGSLVYHKNDRQESSWAAQEGPMLIPPSNLHLTPYRRSTGTSIDVSGWGVGVGLTHTGKLSIKILKNAIETGELEAETDEGPKKPNIGIVLESYFSFPNEYSGNTVLTDSDLILTERTIAIAITADMRFRTASAADFRRQYKKI